MIGVPDKPVGFAIVVSDELRKNMDRIRTYFILLDMDWLSTLINSELCPEYSFKPRKEMSKKITTMAKKYQYLAASAARGCYRRWGTR